MKWILTAATLLTFPLIAVCKKADCPPAEGSTRCWRPETFTEVECEPDLFKMYDQVFSGTVEFLLWTIAEGGLDYAIRMEEAAWGPTASYAQGTYKTAGYNLDPGFRVNLTYFRAPHYWDMRWQYTRMTNRGSDRESKPGPAQNFLTGTWPQITTSPLTAAYSHIHFNYNVFDWIACRVFFPNPHLRLRVGAGAALAWMSQNWQIRYEDSASQSTTIRNQWDYVGGGMKNGIIVDWYMTKELYMTGQGIFGVFLGGYANSSKQTTTAQIDPADNPSVPIRNASYSDVRPAFTAQVSFGPSYQHNFASNRLELFAGFEMNLWTNLQEIYRSTSGTASAAKETLINASSLMLYGITTRATFDF